MNLWKSGIALMLAIPFSATAADVAIYAYGPENATISILSASADTDTRMVSLVVQNLGTQEIQSLTVAGRGFLSGKRVGGFVISGPVGIVPNGYATIHASVDSDLLDRIDHLLLIPLHAVSGTKLDVLSGDEPPLRTAAEAGVLISGTDTLRASSKSITGPNLSGGCCDYCFQQAKTCGGNPVPRGACSGACTTYYSCSWTVDGQGNCISSTCTFNCRDSSSCCM